MIKSNVWETVKDGFDTINVNEIQVREEQCNCENVIDIDRYG